MRAESDGVDGLVLGATLSSASGLLIIATAPAWPVVLLGSLLSGAGAGGMDSGFNAAVALREDRRLMGLLHAGYGFGAAIGPVIVGASLATGGGWRPGYVVFAAASLLLAIPLAGRSMGDVPPQEAMGSPRGLLLPCLAFGQRPSRLDVPPDGAVRPGRNVRRSLGAGQGPWSHSGLAATPRPRRRAL